MKDSAPKKRTVVWRKSLSARLLGWFLFLSLAPMSIITWQTYTSSSSFLKRDAILNLERTALSNVDFITNWFFYRQADLASWSENTNTIEFTKKLQNAFQTSNLSLNDFINSFEHKTLLKKFERDLVNIAHKYDYIYNLFIIDTQGNILYGTEKNHILETNIFSESYAITKFTDMYRQTIHDNKIHFSDLERYKPSNNAIFSFMSAPIIDKNGDSIGVLAIQLKLNRVMARLNDRLHAKSGVMHYLVGFDGRLRSPIHNNDNVLITKINTKQFQQWHDEFTKETTQAEEKVFEYLGPNNNMVFGIHNDINILGVRWALISEADEAIVLSSIKEIAQQSAIIVSIATLVLLITILFLARRITQPLKELAEASKIITETNSRDMVMIHDESEIGLLANSFNDMINQLGENEAILEERTAEAEEALQSLSEQKLALDAHSLVAITTVKGTITYVNDKFVEISGYSREELIGQNHRILNSNKYTKQFWKSMYATISSGNIWNHDIRNIAKDGHYYWVDTTIVPFLNEKGKPKSYIALRTDITQNKENEESLMKAKEEAEIGARAKAEFLASMSHEIRTPMNGVLGMLGLLLNTKMTDTQRHQALIAQTSAKSLLTLINDILDFSKIEAGKIELENIEFHLRDALGDFAEAIAFRAEEKGVELILDVKDIERTIVIADPGRFRQILTNLVGNAIKFTSKGEIVITAKLEVKNEQNAKVHLSVKDCGIGIPEDKLSSLFESFSQVDSSTTRKYGGTGLGLSIAKRLTELMGGQISVTSQVGVGSTFSFSINVGLCEHSSLVVPPFDVSGKNVLFVDDNAVNRKMVREQLTHWGMNVVEASGASQGLEIIEGRIHKDIIPPFDIALIDMYMPTIDGEKFGEELREIPECNSMKMVIMTSLNSNSDATVYAKIGFNGFFSKPTTTRDLFNALNVLIEDEKVLNDSKSMPPVTQSLNMLNTKETKWPQENKILLVEDNTTNQLVALGILETFGLSADIANNGKEAIIALNTSNEPYAIVLMDCQMPVMDGYEATKAIREAKAGEINKTIPIIAMTANAMTGDKEKCFISGMDDYLSKPINPEALKNILKKWMNIFNDVEEKKKSIEVDTENGELVIWDEEDALLRLSSNSTLLDKITKVFSEELPKDFDKLCKSFDEQNAQNIMLHAHTIKGSAANISALKLQDVAKKIEHLARDEKLESASRYLDDLREAKDELLDLLQLRVSMNEKITVAVNFDKDTFATSLNNLQTLLQQGTFVDTDKFEIFKGSGNEKADKLLTVLKSKINSFEFDEALEILNKIDEVSHE